MDINARYREWQRMLLRMGYSCSIDGHPTEQFFRSLRAFKRDVRLPDTDEMDEVTFQTLTRCSGVTQ